MRLKSAVVLCLFIFFTHVSQASRPSLLEALGDSISAMRAAPHIAHVPLRFGGDEARWLKANKLMRGESVMTGFDTKRLLETTPNLFLLSLHGPVFSDSNRNIVSSLGDALKPLGEIYLRKTLQEAHWKTVKPDTERHLINFKGVVNSLKYTPHDKVVLLIEELDTEESLQLAGYLNSFQMPGFIYFTEVDREFGSRSNVYENEERGTLKPLVSIYQSGRLVMESPYESSTSSSPGHDCFFPIIASYLFQEKRAVNRLPLLGHHYEKTKDSDLGVYNSTNFDTGFASGFIRPEVEGDSSYWMIMRRFSDEGYGTFARYPRIVEKKD